MIGVRESAFGNLVPLSTIYLLNLQQVDKRLLNTVKEPIRQGFSWATREGPLCEERKYISSFPILPIHLASHVSTFIWTRPSRGLFAVTMHWGNSRPGAVYLLKAVTAEDASPTKCRDRPHAVGGGTRGTVCSSHAAVQPNVDPLQLLALTTSGHVLAFYPCHTLSRMHALIHAHAP